MVRAMVVVRWRREEEEEEERERKERERASYRETRTLTQTRPVGPNQTRGLFGLFWALRGEKGRGHTGDPALFGSEGPAYVCCLSVCMPLCLHAYLCVCVYCMYCMCLIDALVLPRGLHPQLLLQESSDRREGAPSSTDIV